MDLIFDNTQGREEIKETLTDYINSKAVPIKLSVPTALIYGESGETKVEFYYHPHKLGEAIYDVLHAAKDVHDWHAGVYFDRAIGLAMVFFTNKDNVGVPELFLTAPIGTA